MTTLKILTTFKPLAHRIELIRTIETPELTINFYDDGAATEPDAVAAAVLSTTQNDNQFLWLQLTGKDANSNLDNLISTLKKQHNQIFKIDFCGEIGGRIYENMYSKPIKNIKFKDLTTAQFDIFEIQIIEFIEFIEDKNLHQKPVLQIVLSPCGKSFDEFGNYLDRCNWWQSKVKSIQLNGN
jgi:UDP-N-acetylmuramoylalanine-D-glutamate ligase